MLRCRNYLHFPYILRYVVQLTQVGNAMFRTPVLWRSGFRGSQREGEGLKNDSVGQLETSSMARVSIVEAMREGFWDS